MTNPFWLLISKYFEKDITPELTMEELSETMAAPHIIKELESVRNKETIRDDATSQRIERRRQGVRRNSRDNS